MGGINMSLNYIGKLWRHTLSVTSPLFYAKAAEGVNTVLSITAWNTAFYRKRYVYIFGCASPFQNQKLYH